MCSTEENTPVRTFWTPPAKWNPRQRDNVTMTMSDGKKISPSSRKGDLFHVIHKVPAGDSPYVRAKHVQLIEKDPNRAISLFWAAINAGDRVDSSLKDMAVVMKQLDRAEEAIEAIKSFRHLCSFDSQESLDNVLLELYKRCGMIEAETELLQRKLKRLEESNSCGQRIRNARSQGKRTLVTAEQEKSRILGNLAWAHLQQHNYGIAEQHYRKALDLDADKNKQCNLALCLMHMNRIAEAKLLLKSVKDSSETEQMDATYSKSYERALEMLRQKESKESPEHESFRPKFSSDLTPEDKFFDDWSEGSRSGSRYPRCTRMKENWNPSRRDSGVIITQPRTCYARIEASISPASSNGRYSGVLFTQPSSSERPWAYHKVSGTVRKQLSFDTASVLGEHVSADKMGNICFGSLGSDKVDNIFFGSAKDKSFSSDDSVSVEGSITGNSKSWADMADEEEERNKRRAMKNTKLEH